MLRLGFPVKIAEEAEISPDAVIWPVTSIPLDSTCNFVELSICRLIWSSVSNLIILFCELPPITKLSFFIEVKSVGVVPILAYVIPKLDLAVDASVAPVPPKTTGTVPAVICWLPFIDK